MVHNIVSSLVVGRSTSVRSWGVKVSSVSSSSRSSSSDGSKVAICSFIVVVVVVSLVVIVVIGTFVVSSGVSVSVVVVVIVASVLGVVLSWNLRAGNFNIDLATIDFLVVHGLHSTLCIGLVFKSNKAISHRSFSSGDDVCR